jgi:micrococcal nuclease|tara:strand:+ start:823 stop:1170 length:348 start_codon:yes stop_codon:yes gene_type:complete
MYTYQCNTIRVIDGNTVDATIDLGFNVTIRQRIKLYGVNVSDIRSSDDNVRQQAMASKQKLAELLGNEFVCETIVNKRGKAGRVMGKLSTVGTDGSRVDVNQQLIDQGFAERFGE